MTTESVCDLSSSLIWASCSQFYNPYTWHPSMTLATNNWCLLLRCTQSTKWIWVLDWLKLGFHFARHSLTFCKQSVIEEDRSCKKALTKQNSQWPGFEPVPWRSVHRAVSGSGYDRAIQLIWFTKPDTLLTIQYHVAMQSAPSGETRQTIWTPSFRASEASLCLEDH